MSLSAATIDWLPAHSARPDDDRMGRRIGIGTFMRTHQEVFTDRAMVASDRDRDRSIVGASLRSAAVCDTLAPQDELFTVTENDADGTRTGLSGSVRDEAPVLTESFAQWVIEDELVGSRPRWDAIGRQIVADVAPYETAKLRVLNGARSALAYLGLQFGLSYVHEAIADLVIGPSVERLMRDEAAASVDPASGQDLTAYADALLVRFANPTPRHALRQIASEGSQKISQRWLASLEANRARGRTCPETPSAMAASMLHGRGDGRAVDHPRASELAAAWNSAGRDGIVDAVVGERGLLAGTRRPRLRDRAILAEKLAAFDRR